MAHLGDMLKERRDKKNKKDGNETEETEVDETKAKAEPKAKTDDTESDAAGSEIASLEDELGAVTDEVNEAMGEETTEDVAADTETVETEAAGEQGLAAMMESNLGLTPEAASIAAEVAQGLPEYADKSDEQIIKAIEGNYEAMKGMFNAVAERQMMDELTAAEAVPEGPDIAALLGGGGPGPEAAPPIM